MAEKKGEKAPAKKAAEPKAEKPSAAKKLVEGVKSAAKAVADAVTHPKAAAKEVVKEAKTVVAEAREKVVEAVTGHKPANGHAADAHVRGLKRTLSGTVKSDKMDKTVVVEVVSLKRDPVYGKYLKDRMRYKAHDEKNEYKTGDRVEISEHRPLSRHKRWIVSKLIERARPE